MTESYLSGVLGLGGLFAGLLSNAGIGLLVLLRPELEGKRRVVAILYGWRAGGHRRHAAGWLKKTGETVQPHSLWLSKNLPSRRFSEERKV